MTRRRTSKKSLHTQTLILILTDELYEMKRMVQDARRILEESRNCIKQSRQIQGELTIGRAAAHKFPDLPTKSGSLGKL